MSRSIYNAHTTHNTSRHGALPILSETLANPSKIRLSMPWIPLIEWSLEPGQELLKTIFNALWGTGYRDGSIDQIWKPPITSQPIVTLPRMPAPEECTVARLRSLLHQFCDGYHDAGYVHIQTDSKWSLLDRELIPHPRVKIVHNPPGALIQSDF